MPIPSGIPSIIPNQSPLPENNTPNPSLNNPFNAKITAPATIGAPFSIPNLPKSVPINGAMINAQQSQANLIAQQNFAADNVKLDDGTYVSQSAFNTLSPTDQASLMKLGVSGFNAQQSAVQQAYLQLTATLAPYSTTVPATSTTPASTSVNLASALAGGVTQAQLLTAGFTQAQIDAAVTANQQQATFLANNVKLDDGTYVSQSAFNTLSPTDQASLMKLGVSGFNAQQSAVQQAYLQLTATLAPYSTTVPATSTTPASTSVNLASALAGGVTQAQLLTAGFTQDQINSALANNQLVATLAPYSTTVPATGTTPASTSVNLDSALAGGVTQAQLLTAGFTQDQINSALANNQLVATLAPYSTTVPATGTTPASTSVNLDSALAGGVTQAQLLTAGFTQAQIDAAVTANQQQATFLANNVKLDDGTYVSQSAFNTLSPTDQASLMKLGVSGFNAQQSAVQQAYLQLTATLAPYSTTVPATSTTPASTSVNLASALAGGVTQAQLLTAGFTQDQINSALANNQLVATLAPYSTTVPATGTTPASTSVNLDSALAGGVTQAQLLTAGFTQDQINSALANNQLVATLAPYSTTVPATGTTPASTSVNLDSALAGGVTQAQLLTAGFTQAQIDAAVTANQQQATFLANNVKLDDGTYVSQSAFNTLSPTDQASLKSLGVAGFNAQQTAANQVAQQQQQTFLSQNTQIAGGQYVSNTFYNELTPTAQSIIKNQGISGFNSWLQGTPTTTTVQVAGTSTPDNDPAHQMALVTYNDGSTATMQALAVQAMAAEGGLQAWSIVSWTPIPTPPIVTPPTTQTVTTTVAPSLADVYNNSGWKPNFDSSTNGGNPYAGMPSWYQQVESAGFVPSPANGTTPPSQAYVPLATGVTYPTNVGQTAFTAMQSNPATYIEGAVYTGYNPITGQLSYSLSIPANSVKLSDGSYVSNAYYGTLSPTDQLKLSQEGLGTFLGTANIGLTQPVLAQMKADNPVEYNQYMQDILTMGNTGAAQAHLTLINNAIAAINTQVTVPVSTSGVYNFDTWAAGLTAGLTVGNNPAYVQAKTNQALYQDAGGGLAGYNAIVQDQVSGLNTYLKDIYTNAYNLALKSNPDAVDAATAGLGAVNSAQTTAMQTLTDGGYINSDGTVNWTKVTKDGIDTTVLVQAGFTPAEISGQFGQAPTTLASALKTSGITYTNPVTGQTSKIQTGIDIALNNPASIALSQTVYANAMINANPNQDTVNKLKQLGYNQEIVDAAQNQVINGHQGIETINASFHSGIMTDSEQTALANAMYNAGVISKTENIFLNQSSKDQINNPAENHSPQSVWNNLTSDQQSQVANLYVQDLFKSNTFAEVANQFYSEVQTEGLIPKMLLNTMVTSITEPIALKVTDQPVSATQVTGAITSGLIDLAMITGIGELIDGIGAVGEVLANATLGLQIGAAGVNLPNTINTVTNLDTSLGEKALAVGGESLMAGNAMVGGMTMGNEVGLISEEKIPIKAPSTAESMENIEQGINATKTTEDLSANVEKVQSQIPEVNSAYRTLADIKATPSNVYNSIINNVASGSVATLNSINAGLDDIQSLLSDIGNYIKNNAYEDATIAIKTAGENIANLSAQVSANVGQFSADTINNIQAGLSDVKSALSDATNYIKNNAYQDATIAIKTAGESISNTTSTVLSNAGKLYVDTTANLQVGLSNVQNSLDDIGTYIKTGAYQDATLAIQGMSENLSNIQTQASTMAQNAVVGIGQSYADTLNNISLGVSNIQNGLSDAVSYLNNNAYDDAYMAIQSAKTAISDLSSNVVSNVGKASVDTMANIQTGMQDIQGSMSDAVNYLKNNAYNDAYATITTARDNVNNVINQISANASKLPTDIQTNLLAGLSDVKVALDDAVNYLKNNAYDDAVTSIKGAIEDFKNNMQLAESTNQLYKSLNDVNSKIDNLNDTINDSSSTQAQIDSAKSSLNNSIETLKTVDPSLFDKLTDLQGKVDDIQKPMVVKSTTDLIKQIISKLDPDDQATAIKQLLNTNNRVKFDAWLDMVKNLPAKYPKSLINDEVDFSGIQVFKGNQALQDATLEFLSKHTNDIETGGSAARIQFGLADSGHDLDAYTLKGGSLTPEEATEEYATTIRKYLPNSDVVVRGTKLSVDGVDIWDIHPQGYLGVNPFGMPNYVDMQPVVIGGISFVPPEALISDLVATSTVPGVDEAAGLMGAGSGNPAGKEVLVEDANGNLIKMGTHAGRIEDYTKAITAFDRIADAGDIDPATAQLIRDNLATIQNTNNGEPITFKQTYWKGIKIGDNPIIGTSNGHLTVGTAGIEVPDVKTWNITEDLEGKVSPDSFRYPESGVATKILLNEDIMDKAGFTAEQKASILTKVNETINGSGNVANISGKVLTPENLLQGTDTLSASQVKAVMQVLAKYQDVVESIRFGSSTLSSELQESLLEDWVGLRGKIAGDIDVRFNTADADLVSKIMNESIAAAQSVDDGYPIGLGNKPTLATGVSQSTGEASHSLDFHYIGEDGSSVTPTQAYGLNIAQKPEVVNIDDVGKFKVSTIAETARGKAASVLEFRVDPDTGEVIVSSAGYRTVKDMADLYTIIKSSQGEDAANKWAEVMGYDVGNGGNAPSGTSPNQTATGQNIGGQASGHGTTGQTGSGQVTTINSSGISTNPTQTINNITFKALAGISLTDTEQVFADLNEDAIAQSIADAINTAKSVVSFSPILPADMSTASSVPVIPVPTGINLQSNPVSGSPTTASKSLGVSPSISPSPNISPSPSIPVSESSSVSPSPSVVSNIVSGASIVSPSPSVVSPSIKSTSPSSVSPSTSISPSVVSPSPSVTSTSPSPSPSSVSPSTSISPSVVSPSPSVVSPSIKSPSPSSVSPSTSISPSVVSPSPSVVSPSIKSPSPSSVSPSTSISPSVVSPSPSVVSPSIKSTSPSSVSPSTSISPSVVSPSPSVVSPSIKSTSPSSVSPSTSISPSVVSPSPSVTSTSPSPSPNPITVTNTTKGGLPYIPSNNSHPIEYADVKPKAGSLVWRQGMFWKYLPPPYKDIQTFKKPPIGVSNPAISGVGSSYKSLEIIGGAPKFKRKVIDLGWSNVLITVRGGKPEIEYLQGADANTGANAIRLQKERQKEAKQAEKSDIIIYPEEYEEAEGRPIRITRTPRKHKASSNEFIMGVKL